MMIPQTYNITCLFVVPAMTPITIVSLLEEARELAHRSCPTPTHLHECLARPACSPHRTVLELLHKPLIYHGDGSAENRVRRQPGSSSSSRRKTVRPSIFALIVAPSPDAVSETWWTWGNGVSETELGAGFGLRSCRECSSIRLFTYH